MRTCDKQHIQLGEFVGRTGITALLSLLLLSEVMLNGVEQAAQLTSPYIENGADYEGIHTNSFTGEYYPVPGSSGFCNGIWTCAQRICEATNVPHVVKVALRLRPVTQRTFNCEDTFASSLNRLSKYPLFLTSFLLLLLAGVFLIVFCSLAANIAYTVYHSKSASTRKMEAYLIFFLLHKVCTLVSFGLAKGFVIYIQKITGDEPPEYVEHCGIFSFICFASAFIIEAIYAAFEFKRELFPEGGGGSAEECQGLIINDAPNVGPTGEESSHEGTDAMESSTGKLMPCPGGAPIACEDEKGVLGYKAVVDAVRE